MMIDSLLLFTSFVAGLLTILAPCVLPLLPVIIGGSAGSRNKWRPFIMTASLAVSIIVFTLLLKATTLFIEIPQSVWTGIAGGIVLIFGLFMLFPGIWEFISEKLKLQQRSQSSLSKASQDRETVGGAILMGAALGPVFSSCSPTYFVILATVLPVSFFAGIVYLIVYGVGLALLLGLIGFFGQRIVHKLGWASDPRGWFKRGLGVLLILVGLAVVTGIEKKIESAILDAGFGVTSLEENLLEEVNEREMRQDGQEIMDLKPSGENELPFLYKAPELRGLENWINSEGYSSMQKLEGKVVLVDFWTYSCINCIRTLPYLQSWHEKYADDGLVILGVHAPEFQFEQKIENVRNAVEEYGLTYPVVQDNDFELWRAYNNRYWPAKYLIDKDGIVRYMHFGEGEYEETEAAITMLLDTEMQKTEVQSQSVDFSQIGTRETYLGTRRRENKIPAEQPLREDQWKLTGDWLEEEERVICQSADCGITLKFHAAKANLVMGGQATATVLIDGETATAVNAGSDVTNGQVSVNEERLYQLANFDGEYSQHTIELRFDEPGVELYAWTFG
jgi:cytochrome c biogenesis protein CcdA/thiol-disulfide isomerase/thioredoxin